jgi:hypothetical protein
MGDQVKGKTPFWEHPQWYPILRNAIWWVSHKDTHFQE